MTWTILVKSLLIVFLLAFTSSIFANSQPNIIETISEIQNQISENEYLTDKFGEENIADSYFQRFKELKNKLNRFRANPENENYDFSELNTYDARINDILHLDYKDSFVSGNSNDSPAGTNGLIRGVVTDSDTGNIITNGYARLYNSFGNYVMYSSLDSVGRYTFSNVSSGQYAIIVFSSYSTNNIDTAYPSYPCINGLGYGCQISELNLINLSAGEILENINVAMINRPTISGNISDETDNLLKIESVNVRLYSESGNYVASGNSDSMGNYAIAAPNEGNYILQFSHSMYQTELYDNVICNGVCDLNLGTIIHLDVNQRLENLNVSMKKNADINGDVIDGETLQLLDNAHLFILNENNDVVSSIYLNSNTSWFATLPQGLYTVAAERSGYLATKYDGIGCFSENIQDCNLISGTQISHTLIDTNNISLKMQKGAYITGIISDITNQPLNNINVNVFNSVNNQLMYHAGTRSIVDGSYVTKQLGDGSYYLVISSNYSFPAEMELYDNVYCEGNSYGNCDFNMATPITISNQTDVNNINFTAKALSQISGRVVDTSNNPISGLYVIARSENNYYSSSAFTNLNGEYIINRIFRGTYQLYVRGDSRYYSESYDDVQCVNDDCNGDSYTPLVLNQSNLSNKNFQISSKGKVNFNLISNSANNIESGGFIVATDLNGQIVNYSNSLFELFVPAGSYYFYYQSGSGNYNNSHSFVSKVYGGSNCINTCDATTGILVQIADDSQQTLTMNLDEYFYVDITNNSPRFSYVKSYNQDLTLYSSNGFYETTRQIIRDTNPKYIKLSETNYYSQVYNGVNCVDDQCDILQGNPITPQLNTSLNLDFTLVPLASLQGRITDDNNNPLSGVFVSIQSDLAQNYGLITVQTDLNGDYSFNSMPIGNWYLKVQSYDTFQEFGENATTFYGNIACDDYDCTQKGIQPITIDLDDNLINFDIQAVKRGTLSGEGIKNVFNEFLPTEIYFYKSDGSYVNLNSKLVSNGVLNPIYLPMGEYNIVARPQTHVVLSAYPDFDCGNENYASSCAVNSVPLMVSNGSDTHFNSFVVHQSGILKGVIRDSSTLQPISQSIVELYNLNNGVNRVSYAFSNSNGEYELNYNNNSSLKVYFNNANQQYLYISQLYNGINCIYGLGIDCLLTQGQDVDFSHDTLNVIDVNLVPKPILRISVVDNITNMKINSYNNIYVYDVNNNLVYQDYSNTQEFLISTLTPGSYYVIVSLGGGYPTTGYPNIICESFTDPETCHSTLTAIDLNIGDPIQSIVIRSQLLQGINGYVHDASTGLPLENIIIDYWNENGYVSGSVTTSANGGFSKLTGVGNYYLSTDTNNAYINEIYKDINCSYAAILGNCDITQGLMINVPENNESPIIVDVKLNRGIFVNGFE